MAAVARGLKDPLASCPLLILRDLKGPLGAPYLMHNPHITAYTMRYTHHDRGPFVAITTVAELVRTARNGRSQKEFARELGVRQSSVSRYESGRVNPPVTVIEHCMRQVHSTGTESAPTADELAAKVRTDLADSDLGDVRLALARLIATLVNGHARGRSMSPSSRWDGGFDDNPIND